MSARLVVLRRSLMGFTDKRVGLMNEIVNSMQVRRDGGNALRALLHRAASHALVHARAGHRQHPGRATQRC